MSATSGGSSHSETAGFGDSDAASGEGPDDVEIEPMDENARRKAEAAIDHALLRQALDGDEAGFSGLVERHQRRAYRVARNLVPTDEDAQDLAQEAFLRVFKSLDRFDFNHEFTTWLYRIVTNLCIDFLRKRRSAISVSSGRGDDEDAAFDLEDQNMAAPSAQAEAMETAAEVAAVLETLAPHFQSVLNLREIEGLSCPEIAEIVGATHVTVRWRLHRGRKLFQEEWERRARMRSQGAADLLGGQEGDSPSDPALNTLEQTSGLAPTPRADARTSSSDGSTRSGKKA